MDQIKTFSGQIDSDEISPLRSERMEIFVISLSGQVVFLYFHSLRGGSFMCIELPLGAFEI